MGKIDRALPVHGKTSIIHQDGITIYQGLPNPFPAIHYHSLIIETEGLPYCLEITAKTREGTIMGMRQQNYVV